MMNQDPTGRPDLMSEVRIQGPEIRFRVPLPVAIPLGAILLIAVLTIGFSQILLNVPGAIASTIAILTAMNILAAGAFIALRPNMSRATLIELFAVALYPFLIGIVVAQTGVGAATTVETNAARGANEGGGGGLELVAEGVAWDTSNLQVPAGQKASITIDNQDSVPHDFAVYESRQAAADTGDALFASPEVAGGSSLDFSFGPLKKGSYFFQCNIHPTTMTGTVVAQ